jgi:hypothetical protein
MECHEFWEIVDLSVEGNHEAILHLDECANCRSELAARQALPSKLRQAFISSPVNRMRPEFVRDLSSRLRDAAIESRSIVPTRRSTRPRYFIYSVAACLLMAALIGSIVVRQQLSRPTPNIVEAELAKAAAGDHRDCAIHFRLLEKPIALEVAGREYDPVYLDLTKIFTEASVAIPDVQVVEAHSCVFEGRRFAHVVLRFHGSLVSLLVTDIPGSSSKDPATIASSQIEGYNVSFFQTARHAVFVVSDVPEGDNLALTRAFAPRVLEHIKNREQTSNF